MPVMTPLTSIAFVTLTAAASSFAQDLSDNQISSIRQRLGEAAQRSWELGTRAQVTIEYDIPSFNVLSKDMSFPLPSTAPDGLEVPLNVAERVMNEKPQGIKPFFEDGSVADPASVGPVVLIANWTNQDGHEYGEAAQMQLDYLLNDAPKSREGAISHRVENIQFWSDYVYMVPPFLAFYGAIQGNNTLLDEAYHQIELYRNALKDDSGLWRHIAGDANVDEGHWSTGNGWAAMGILRVAGTYRAYSSDYNNKQNTLFDWAEEIIQAMYSAHDGSGSQSTLFKNYVDRQDTFEDGASTALLAAATYRLAVLSDGGRTGRIVDAEQARKQLSGGDHIDSNGWLSPVVDPHNFPREGEHSAEGQAFVVSMQAAYRAWKDAGSPGADGAASRMHASSVVMLVVVALTGVMLA